MLRPRFYPVTSNSSHGPSVGYSSSSAPLTATRPTENTRWKGSAGFHTSHKWLAVWQALRRVFGLIGTDIAQRIVGIRHSRG